MHQINKNDYKILGTLVSEECFSPYCSLTAAQLAEKTNLCVSKVRRTLNEFKTLNYVDTEMKQGNAKAFFVTESGISVVKEKVLML